MSEEEINEALKIIKEPITVNSIEYKYFNQENYEKLLSVYENAKWFVSNWEQALQNIEDLQQKVEQLENENFNIRENIHLEKISLPPELTKDKDFMELYDIPSYKVLQQKVEQLEKENIKQKEIIENLTTMTVCGDKKQIKNTAQYKLEQLENIRKEVIEYIKDNACYSEGHCKCSFSQIALDNLLNILNKGENNE
jgi:hypothetical protein